VISTSKQRLTHPVQSLLRERRARSAVRIAAIPGPYVTIQVGGPLDGIVTLTATDSPRVIVGATWSGRHDRDRMSLTRPGEREALLLADSWTNQLIDGHEPTRDLLRPPRHR
jgi:hypothetical protein